LPVQRKLTLDLDLCIPELKIEAKKEGVSFTEAKAIFQNLSKFTKELGTAIGEYQQEFKSSLPKRRIISEQTLQRIVDYASNKLEFTLKDVTHDLSLSVSTTYVALDYLTERKVLNRWRVGKSYMFALVKEPKKEKVDDIVVSDSETQKLVVTTKQQSLRDSKQKLTG